MRILFVSSGLDPRTGGTATAAVSVCLAARRAGLEVDLLYPVEREVEPLLGPTVALLAAAGVTVRAFPSAATSAPCAGGFRRNSTLGCSNTRAITM
jgi:hypothetical protein